ncbi:hypothetical protein G9F72_015455 [Clostridium estertheticum]|uniref:hypothetical protein n=1 Tax=Clostridium estertheticum TaxID=238834 RepID=UPI0013E8FAAC|nr:hypothetical protein [Clostridium estertheticum]MBZ9687728.1 hypothetical protein [Clostridium estertheticum]
MFNNKYFASHACDKLYKKDLFEDIRYPVGKLYEDMFTTYRLFEKAYCVVFTDYIGYNYLQRIDSIVQSEFTIEKLDYIDSFDGIFNVAVQKYPKSIKSINIAYVSANITMLRSMYKSCYLDIINKSKIQNNVRRKLMCFCRSLNVSMKAKIIAILVAIDYRLYGFLVIIKQNLSNK